MKMSTSPIYSVYLHLQHYLLALNYISVDPTLDTSTTTKPRLCLRVVQRKLLGTASIQTLPHPIASTKKNEAVAVKCVPVKLSLAKTALSSTVFQSESVAQKRKLTPKSTTSKTLFPSVIHHRMACKSQSYPTQNKRSASDSTNVPSNFGDAADSAGPCVSK